jgi:hypothetical protein
VFATEPLPTDHPLRTAPNVVLTPHIGWKVDEVFTEWAEIAADQLAAWLAGRLPATEVLDPAAAQVPRHRLGGLERSRPPTSAGVFFPGPDAASVASVHRVATIPQAPGEFLLHRESFVARGHRIEAPIQPWAKVLPMLPHIPRGSVALLVLTKALLRRHHALADVEGGIPRVAAGTDCVVQLDHVDVVAVPGWSCSGCA